jgi:hypothetical protein
VLSQFGHHAGVVWLRRGGEDPGRLIAINRPPAESSSGRMTAAELEKLLSDVPLQAVAVEVSPDGTGRGVVRELWAVVWLCVIAGLLVEAVLSLPPGRRAAP